MKTIKAAMVLFLLVAIEPSLFAQYKYPFQNPNLPVERRIRNVLSLLTLQEKIDLLGKNLNVPRLGIYGSGRMDSIPGSSGQDEGLHGVAMGGPNNWGGHSPGRSGDKSTITTTQFPQPVGLGETWDPALLEKAAVQEGCEARYIFQTFNRGGLIVRAPNADLARDPRWGRSEESYGEDPYFVGTMSVAFVKGLQGDNPKYWRTASLIKHFLANSNEDNRAGSSSNFDERLLHEYYAVPFRMAIEQGGANALMTAYNAVNGIPMAASPLLKNVTMRDWGFNGMIDTDRGAVTFMVTRHKYYPNIVEAVAGSIHAGVNQFLNEYQKPIEGMSSQDPIMDALDRKLITEADIDENLQGVLRVMIRLGFLDATALDPYTKIKQSCEVPAPWDQPSAKALALLATQESIVLLKNSTQLLPLSMSSVKSVAVVGPLANVVYLDGYSGTPPFAVTPLEGIKNKAGTKVDVRYTDDDSKAAALAKSSDVAIVFVGNRPFCRRPRGAPPCIDPTEGQEGIDRKEINLKPGQEKLIQDVYAANPHTIVVLVSSFPYTIDWEAEHIPSILNIANNSEEEGNALASVLFGDYNPGGHLAETWPRSLDQEPPMMDYNIRDGRTYMYFHGSPLFPFGYGLSYTSFAYSDLQTRAASLASGQSLQVSLKLKNTGQRQGDEVVQMYVKFMDSRISRPALELEGFQRVSLAAGQSKLVKLPLTAKSLMYWNTAQGQWALEQGKVRILIGSSSQNAHLSADIHVQ